ncbi:rCG50481 [Rattus norvegicus]|uniref:RCG50481 n=1 Tax=Rattus norvegicus TaxID=10116 RepID=A6JZE4_RAT|nr:rCG50481 [Rattus norvegicus]
MPVTVCGARLISRFVLNLGLSRHGAGQ